MVRTISWWQFWYTSTKPCVTSNMIGALHSHYIHHIQILRFAPSDSHSTTRQDQSIRSPPTPTPTFTISISRPNLSPNTIHTRSPSCSCSLSLPTPTTSRVARWHRSTSPPPPNLLRHYPATTTHPRPAANTKVSVTRFRDFHDAPTSDSDADASADAGRDYLDSILWLRILMCRRERRWRRHSPEVVIAALYFGG